MLFGKEKKKTVAVCAAALFAVAALLFLLVWNGVIPLNDPPRDTYPVRGVDVSSYQGEIDWAVLSAQDISFAFIKATEGSGLVDPRFGYNYAQAQKTTLRIGAYHFFSFDSAGQTQAENFISAVSKIDGMLPPVVDFEFYGDKEKNPPDADAARAQLDVLLARLEAYYGVKPILYATEKSYAMYLAGHYDAYDLWIRNVITAPRVAGSREWTFWQYTNRERLEGYAGEEKYIDVNVFRGTSEEFADYGK